MSNNGKTSLKINNGQTSLKIDNLPTDVDYDNDLLVNKTIELLIKLFNDENDTFIFGQKPEWSTSGEYGELLYSQKIPSLAERVDDATLRMAAWDGDLRSADRMRTYLYDTFGQKLMGDASNTGMLATDIITSKKYQPQYQGFEGTESYKISYGLRTRAQTSYSALELKDVNSTMLPPKSD